MVKHRAALLSKSIPTYKLKKTENMSIQNLHTNGYSSAIHSIPKMGTAKFLVTDEWIQCSISMQQDITEQ